MSATAPHDAWLQRMYQALAEAAAGVDAELPWLLLDLLEVPGGKRFSKLEELRKLERRDSGLGMERALARVEKVLALRARKAQVQAIPANRRAALAKYGMAGTVRRRCRRAVSVVTISGFGPASRLSSVSRM